MREWREAHAGLQTEKVPGSRGGRKDGEGEREGQTEQEGGRTKG